MHKQIFLFLLIIISYVVLAQDKPVIDERCYEKWSTVERAAISDDGKYMRYFINNQPLSSMTLVIQATDKSWRREFKGVGMESGVSFTSDSRHCVMMIDQKVNILELGTGNVEYIQRGNSFSVGLNWLAVHLNDSTKSLLLLNLRTREQLKFPSVTRFQFGKPGEILTIVQKKSIDKDNEQLIWVDLINRKSTQVWEGMRVSNLYFDKHGRQLSFIGMQKHQAIWYFKKGWQGAVSLGNESVFKERHGLGFGNIERFSNDGNMLLLQLKRDKRQLAKSKMSNLVLWSYTDLKLQSEQQLETEKVNYLCSINLSTGNSYELEKENEQVELQTSISDNWAIIRGTKRSPSESHWANATSDFSLLDIRNGSRVNIPAFFYHNRTLSPDGKYLISYNGERKDYFSFELESGIIRNISKSITNNWTKSNASDLLHAEFQSYTPGGWLSNDSKVVLYDEYDVWLMDPSGVDDPVCITNGFGKKNQIEFRILHFDSEKDGISQNARVFSRKNKFILAGFCKKDKTSGFYGIDLSQTNDPRLLSSGPYVAFNREYDDWYARDPVKAKNSESYIVMKMTTTRSPNYFFTKNFTEFKPLTEVYPEKDYNWMTSVLYSWKSLNGKNIQGILYKPENFDSTKKYPVIFHFYEKKSDHLYSYLPPETLTAGCSINIPTYVSQGYLVFCPDIWFPAGDPMQGTYNSVISAAQFVSSLPFVNSKKMGLQGCSWGGFQIYYLITHSNLFAAASPASGVADWISGYGSLNEGQSVHGQYENTLRMNGELWEKPEMYIENSSVFRLDKVTTPTLVMHTTNDIRCLFTNVLEFFIGMRRLGKKVWMLEYKDGNHGIGGRSAIDYNIRMQQFFNHYLKDSAAPRWMLYGIPAKTKNIEDDLELVYEKDKNGRCIAADSDTVTEEEKR